MRLGFYWSFHSVLVHVHLNYMTFCLAYWLINYTAGIWVQTKMSVHNIFLLKDDCIIIIDSYSCAFGHHFCHLWEHFTYRVITEVWEDGDIAAMTTIRQVIKIWFETYFPFTDMLHNCLVGNRYNCSVCWMFFGGNRCFLFVLRCCSVLLETAVGVCVSVYMESTLRHVLFSLFSIHGLPWHFAHTVNPCCPHEVSWLWWSPDFSSWTTMRLIYNSIKPREAMVYIGFYWNCSSSIGRITMKFGPDIHVSLRMRAC